MLLMWVVVLFQLALTFGLLRRVAPVLERAEASHHRGDLASVGGLQPGEIVPDFPIIDSDRTADASFRALAPKPSIVLLIGSGCPPCLSLAEDLIRNESTVGRLDFCVVVQGQADVFLALRRAGIQTVSQDGSASEAFQQRVFPQAFALDGSYAVVASAVPQSVNDIYALARSVAETTEERHDITTT